MARRKKPEEIWALPAAAALLAVLFIAGAVAAPQFSCEHLEGGEHYIWLPKSVSDYFAGERINLKFLMPDGSVFPVHGTVGPGAIDRVQCGSPYEHDYFVSMTWIEALQLATSNKPITTFRQLWEGGRIVASPRGQDNMEKL